MDEMKFRMQAEARVSRVMRGMRQLGSLAKRNANGGRPVLSPGEVDYMFKTLNEELDAAYRLFTTRESAAPQFKFTQPAQQHQ